MLAQTRTLTTWNHGFTNDKVKVSVRNLGRADWVTRGRASTTKASDCRTEQGKADPASQLSHCAAVGLRMLCSWLVEMPIFCT